MTDYKEKDLHPYLVKWSFETWQLACRTIDQSKSKNKHKGENEWVHPDIVGAQLQASTPSTSTFSPTIQSLYQQVNKEVEFYSFELKCSLTLSTLKQYYFQAVSNSSWANYGYLVVAEIDIFDSLLMEELKRLVNAFGIGVIWLRPGQLRQTEILFEATYREQLDFYTMEKISHSIQNSDFRNFLDGVNSCLSSKSDQVAVSSILTNPKHFDPILSDETLRSQWVIEEEPVSFYFEALPPLPTASETEESSNPSIFESIQSRHPGGYTHTQPLFFKIKDDIQPFTSWKDFLRAVCLYARDDNPMLFQQHCYPTEDFQATLFLNDVTDRFAAGRVKAGKQIELEEGLYVVSDLNAKTIVSTIQRIMELFELPDPWIKIALAD